MTGPNVAPVRQRPAVVLTHEDHFWTSHLCFHRALCEPALGVHFSDWKQSINPSAIMAPKTAKKAVKKATKAKKTATKKAAKKSTKKAPKKK